MLMLETVERVKKSKLNELRSKGLIPAVCYNAKNETISIAV
ncbi:50S ribosomal protein L25, partial [Patescibacteria group bacterium]|nr:50S ribosomal protein L25 [Patescibacteria group bacterium]